MGVKTCMRCGKTIELKKECEEDGVIYHAQCFRCYLCKRFLNEYDVRIRDQCTYCMYHANLIGGSKPFCKVYFNDSKTCYRVIYAADEKDEHETDGEE